MNRSGGKKAWKEGREGRGRRKGPKEGKEERKEAKKERRKGRNKERKEGRKGPVDAVCGGHQVGNNAAHHGLPFPFRPQEVPKQRPLNHHQAPIRNFRGGVPGRGKGRKNKGKRAFQRKEGRTEGRKAKRRTQ